MDRRRDDRRDNRDHRDSAPQRNVSYPDRGERQVTRIEKGRDSARSTAADTNDWKAERDRLQSTLVQDGVVKDYGRREDRGRHFPAVDASHLRPHVDFKNREARSNVRGRQDENTPVRPNRKPLPPLKPIDRTKVCSSRESWQ